MAERYNPAVEHTRINVSVEVLPEFAQPFENRWLHAPKTPFKFQPLAKKAAGPSKNPCASRRPMIHDCTSFVDNYRAER